MGDCATARAAGLKAQRAQMVAGLGARARDWRRAGDVVGRDGIVARAA